MIIAVLGFLLTCCLVLILVGLKLVLASIKLGAAGVSAGVSVGNRAIASVERAATKASGGNKAIKAGTKLTQGARRVGTAAIKVSLTVIKRLVGLVETLIGAVAAVTGVGTIVSVLFVVALLTAPTFLLLLTDTSEVNWYNANKASNSTNAQNTSGNFAMPDGMDPDSWAKADETGQQLAAAMINSFANPPSMGFHYSQGITTPGYFDCGRWIAANMSLIGMQQDGHTREKGFDFETEGQLARPYTPTGGLMAMWRGSAAQVGGVDDPSNWAPGDMLLTSGHAAMYLGKNKNGVDIIGHASYSGASGFADPLLTKPATDVIIAPLYSGSFIAIRPSLMLENPTEFP